jgi:hypothetical protein
MALRKRLYRSLLAVMILSLLAPLSIFAEEDVLPPIPYYAYANVNGNRDEWGSPAGNPSNFALIYIGGVAGPADNTIGRLQLVYDCRVGQGVLYANIRPINGAAYLESTPQSITLNGSSIVNQGSGDNGNPPDFAFMDNNHGSAAQGWEGSARVAGGSYTLNIVVTVRDRFGVQQTGRLAPTGSGVSIVIPTETCVLAVTLEDFRATPQSNSILLEWETASETENLGFNVYRSTSPDEVGEKLNGELIPSQAPGSGQGASYEFTDHTGQGGTTYYYHLEDVDFDGTGTMHGPVNAPYPSQPTAITMALFNIEAHDPRWAFTLGALAIGLAGVVGWRWRYRRRFDS